MSFTDLACTLEEDIEYDATPPKVLQSLNSLAARIDKFRADEPDEYLQIGPTIAWSTDNNRSRWKATTALYRKPTPTVPERIVEPAPVTEISHAAPEPIPTPVASLRGSDPVAPNAVPAQPRKKPAGKATAGAEAAVEPVLETSTHLPELSQPPASTHHSV